MGIRFIVLLFNFILIFSPAFSQGYYDTAPRFGQQGLFGSAKSMGSGGLQLGVGADGSAMAWNPASPGLYRKSDIQLSLMPYLNSSKNEFREGSVSADRSGMPIASFSLSLASLKDEIDAGDIRCGVFTVSYNRTTLFTRKSNWEGLSPALEGPNQYRNNSIIDGYLLSANKPDFFPSDLLAADPNNQLIFNDNFKNDLIMAFQAYILDSSGNGFVSAFPRSDIRKSGYYDQKLNQGVWNFGYSVNVKDNLFLGASFGYVSSNYSSEVSYGEEIRNVYVNSSDPDFLYKQGFRGVNFQIIKNLSQKHRAINGNLGIIYKVSDPIRISAAIQLPTLSWLNETYSPRVKANYNGLANWGDRSQTLGSYDVTWFENSFAYKLRLPARYRAGINWILEKKGMLGFEMEYTNLSKSILSEGDAGYNFVEENKIMEQNYRATLNLRLGGELREGDFRFRAGLAYFPSPLKSNALYKNNVHGDAFYITGGIGGKFENWFWDAGLVFGNWKTQYNFTPGIDPDVNSRISSSQLRLGIGFNL